MPDMPSVDDQFDDEDDDDWDDENNDLLYLKYLFEGCATMAELSARLRALATDLDQMAADGWMLARPVDGGYAHLVRELA